MVQYLEQRKSSGEWVRTVDVSNEDDIADIVDHLQWAGQQVRMVTKFDCGSVCVTEFEVPELAPAPGYEPPTN